MIEEDEQEAQRLNLAVVALYAGGIVALCFTVLIFIHELVLPFLENLVK